MATALEELEYARNLLRDPTSKRTLGARWVEAERDPLAFLRWWVWTIDQHDLLNPIKPFPWHRPYLQHITRQWQKYKLITILKARQMMMTWLCVSLALWDALMHQGRLVMLQSKREEDAIGDSNSGDGLLGRAIFIMNVMPCRSLFVPGYEALGNKIKFHENRSTMWAIPQGESIIRQRTASGILSDEACCQPEFGGAYSAAKPAIRGGGWFIALTTPGLEDGGAFRELHEDKFEEQSGSFVKETDGPRA